KEAERQAAEEAEAQRKRDAKKAEKDRKKREAQAKKAQKRKVSGGSEDGDQAVEGEKPQSIKKPVKEKTGRGFFSCCIMLFSVFAVLVAMVVGLAVHCGTNLKDQYCKDYYKPVEQRVLAAADQTQKQAVEYYNTASEVSSEVYASASVRAAEMYQSTRKYLADMLGDASEGSSKGGDERSKDGEKSSEDGSKDKLGDASEGSSKGGDKRSKDGEKSSEDGKKSSKDGEKSSKDGSKDKKSGKT
ncbi:hypothetical protein BaRGS_00036903, partial [Batillaria attramentaria]